jgi:hypothetical protein
MNARLFLLERWLPGPLRRRMLDDLARLTAESFGAAAPSLAGLSRRDAVRRFAEFTRTEAERALAGKGPMTAELVRARLHDRARALGLSVRRRLRIVTRAEAFRALRLLYRGIGIDIDADWRSGRVVVRRCAFSNTYTPEVCALVSALDAGIVAGITGGGALAFSGRITEGASCCRARVEWSGLA